MEIDEILEKVDILEYIQQYCDLEKRSDGEYWGLSPFKEEKTPSFSVNAEKQKFYDFSSGMGGNLISFIMKYDDCSFIEALNKLKKYANITERGGVSTRLESVKIAKKFKHKAHEKKELKSTILPDNYMERYEFNTAKLQVWVDEGIGFDTMRKFDVCYDPFSDRIVFPIKNYVGNIINVCGRTLNDDYKVMGIRKYTYFKPLGFLNTLYGFSDNKDSIIEKQEIIIFEGAKSVMKASEWSINNTCALCTSHLNSQQLLFLIKLGVRVVFALDEDVDISKDANISKLKRYVAIEVVKNFDNLLSEKMSPVDAGREVWDKLYEGRTSAN